MAATGQCLLDLGHALQTVVGSVAQAGQALDTEAAQGQLHTDHVEGLIVDYHDSLCLRNLGRLTRINLIVDFIIRVKDTEFIL